VLPTDDTYKKQRRRECHNQVEKRRREHINAKIEELSQLLPPQYNDPEEAIDDEEEEELPSGNTSSKKKVGPMTLSLLMYRRRNDRGLTPSNRKTLPIARGASYLRACNTYSTPFQGK